MKYLLDTRSSPGYRSTIGASAVLPAPFSTMLKTHFFFTATSLWEIPLKRARYRADFGYDLRVIGSQMVDSDYEELPVTGQHVAAMDSLPPIHKDTFDRLLIAQAMVEGITLLTADAEIARYPGPIRKA
jgi:PIN domain nuclease of toxin-antitoxin system